MSYFTPSFLSEKDHLTPQSSLWTICNAVGALVKVVVSVTIIDGNYTIRLLL